MDIIRLFTDAIRERMVQYKKAELLLFPAERAENRNYIIAVLKEILHAWLYGLVQYLFLCAIMI